MKRSKSILLFFVVILVLSLLPVNVMNASAAGVEEMTINVPSELPVLTGPVDGSFVVQFSDGRNEAVPSQEVEVSTSDESIINITNGKLYPLKEGKATIKASYQNAAAEKEITVTAATHSVTVKSIEHEEGYILGTAGVAIPINGITLQTTNQDGSTGQVTGDQATWTSSSRDLEITADTITAKQAGIYSLVVTRDEGSASLLLVVKDEEDEEYVLYEEDFSSLPDGSIPEEWTKLNGTTDEKVSVKEGALIIDGRGDNYAGTGILLPEYLALFGNYKIEADITHVAANNNSRWHSIMYRVQNNSYPYYQMAVRQNATASNGVEFAERTPANAWHVPVTASYREGISGDKMYRYTLVAHENRVQQWIQDDLLIDTDIATHYQKGRIGFQATGSLTKVDNIKVTLQTEELPKIVQPGDNFVHVSEPDTKISLAPSVVTVINSSEDYDTFLEGKLPATAVLHVNRKLEVTDEQGQKITSLASALEKINERVIPAFSIKDEETIAPLVKYLKSIHLEDAFVLSKDPVLVKKAREAYPMIRGIIEYSVSGQLSENELMDIRRTTNSHLAKVILLPESAASMENITYLQKKLMTVWVKEEKDAKPVDFHRMITAGPNGVVTDQHEEAIDALEFYQGQPTLVRTPYMLAHRGIPGLAPENTLEGAILAYEKGADHIENDIYLTKDGHIVILHDGTLDRTTTGTGYIENYTLAELKQHLANKQFPEQYPNARIPTLREFFEEFKGKDVEHIVEIKSSNPAIIDKLIGLIEEMGVENQVSVISFNADQLQLLAQKMPGMSIGYLTSGIASETNVNPSLRRTLSLIQNLNSTFNTSYAGVGENFMEAAKHRGLTFWPWTYRDQGLFVDYFLLGTNGLTTDYTHWASDWASSIVPVQTEYHLTERRSVELNAQIETYNRQVKEVQPEIVVIDGQEHVTVEGNTITSQGEGTVHALLRYTQELPGGKSYALYTQPITIEVTGKQNAKENQIIIDEENAEIEIGKTPHMKDGILVTTSASIKGEGLKNNSVIISPTQEGTIVNLNGERVQQVIIENSNIKEIRGAENVRKWTVKDGIDVAGIKVYDRDNEEITIK